MGGFCSLLRSAKEEDKAAAGVDEFTREVLSRLRPIRVSVSADMLPSPSPAPAFDSGDAKCVS